jgi:DNA invertase Pin-like site-specific DNA recombinase
MSTEDQQYSIANQKLRIQEYAQAHGFNITVSPIDLLGPEEASGASSQLASRGRPIS